MAGLVLIGGWGTGLPSSIMMAFILLFFVVIAVILPGIVIMFVGEALTFVIATIVNCH